MASVNGWNWHDKRVVVTGSSGFIGQVLLARLLHLGASVAAVDRKPLAPSLAAHPRVLALQLNLEDAEQLGRALDPFSPQVIYHLAAHPDAPELANQAALTLRSNVFSTLNLLELSRAYSLDAFVFAGSSKVYGNSPVPHREDTPIDPQSSYAVSKLAAWNYCRVFACIHKIPAVALRPTLVYGPAPGKNLFTFLAGCLCSGKREIELDGGPQTRDPLYLDDAINAYLRAAEMAQQLRGRAIPIGGGSEHTVKELAELFVAAAGTFMRIRSRAQRLRRTEMLRSYCDNADALTTLRWKPATPLHVGLRLTAKFLLGQDMRSHAGQIKDARSYVRSTLALA